MAPDVGELVAALPEEVEAEAHSAEGSLQELLANLSHKPVPVGRLVRGWVLGSAQAKIALAYLVYWIRTSYASDERKERELNETHLKAAVKLLGSMSYLRGMILKVGQVLAHHPNMLPGEFADKLSRLHFDAPPMHFSLLREQVRNELGAEPEKLFAEFETKAFAAASLGQVHRARLKSGEAVAVKIQYPNIARTIHADLSNMMAILSPMRLSKDWENIRAQWADIRQMLEWETDYQREAEFLSRARAAFSPEENIVVPWVYEPLTTKRVLTMEFLEGVHLDRYMAGNPPQEERDRFGAQISRAGFRVAHTANFWYADSNPGNYIFMRDGRLGLIDFGCCREFSEEEWDYYKHVARGMEQGGEVLHAALLRAIDAKAGFVPDPEYMKLLVELSQWHHEYLQYDGAFDFSDPAYMKRGTDLMKKACEKRYFRSLPVNTWINRHLLGLRSLAHRLGARIDMKTLAREEGYNE